MKVKNINKASKGRCNCSSWLQHWKNFSNQTATICRAKGCAKKATTGAHVIKNRDYDDKWYIVPFCQEHNNSSETVELVAKTKLVPANKSQTCKKTS